MFKCAVAEAGTTLSYEKLTANKDVDLKFEHERLKVKFSTLDKKNVRWILRIQ